MFILFSKSTLLERNTIQLNVDCEFLYYTTPGTNFSGTCEIRERDRKLHLILWNVFEI